MTKIIKDWEKAQHDLAMLFVDTYFKYDDGLLTDYYWIADDVSSVFFVNDYFFDVRRMYEALTLEATYDQLIDYYELEMKAHEDGKVIASFKNYVKYGFTYVN